MSSNKGEYSKDHKFKRKSKSLSSSTSKSNPEDDFCMSEAGPSKQSDSSEKRCSAQSTTIVLRDKRDIDSRNNQNLINCAKGRNNFEFDKGSSTPITSPSTSNHSEQPSQNLHFSFHNDFHHENSSECNVSNAAGQYSPDSEPIHMTLEEVRNSLSSPCSSLTPTEGLNNLHCNSNASVSADLKTQTDAPRHNTLKDCLRRTFYPKFSACSPKNDRNNIKRKSFPSSLKFNLKSIFNIKKSQSVDSSVLQQKLSKSDDQLDWCTNKPSHSISNPTISPFNQRSLPPVPVFYPDGEISNPEYDQEARAFMASVDDGFILSNSNGAQNVRSSDFAASIEKVKDCGWYWGPVNGEVAEKLLSTEPDGSFIVRDSSDEHYIFSLTFKLNGLVRHVRIEHDQGNFSFGSLQKFKSTTIVDFIENAVEHSRSGRYLFFLHRRPVLGPMRVQLLHPLSRFKHVQSLQHQCRFIILKHVRRDFIGDLPIPQRLKDYLSYPNYYSEKVEFLCNEEDSHINPTELPNFTNGDIVDISNNVGLSQIESNSTDGHTYHENSNNLLESSLGNTNGIQNVHNDSSSLIDEVFHGGSDISGSPTTDSAPKSMNSNELMDASNFLISNAQTEVGVPESASCSNPTSTESEWNVTNNLKRCDSFEQFNSTEDWERNGHLPVRTVQSGNSIIQDSYYSCQSSVDETNLDAHYEQLKENDSNLKSVHLSVDESTEKRQLEYLDPQQLNVF